MNRELVSRARQTDLVGWLKRNNVPLVRAGKWWFIEGFDSLRIQGNKWFRNSQGKGGKAIDFLIEFFGCSFKDAVEALTCGTLAYDFLTAKNKPVKEKNICAGYGFSARSFLHDADSRRVIAFLVKTRGIPYGIVKEELRRGFLFQERYTGNAAFVMTDEFGNISGAEVVGTLGRVRFKGLKPGSSGCYSYPYGKVADPRFILFFESAIDLFSFVAISRATNKTLDRCLLVSMAGLRAGIVKYLMRIYIYAAPVLCVDNDPSGYSFISCIRSDFPDAIVKLPDMRFKDWNEQLLG